MQPHPGHIHKVNASDQDFKIPIAPLEGEEITSVRFVSFGDGCKCSIEHGF